LPKDCHTNKQTTAWLLFSTYVRTSFQIHQSNAVSRRWSCLKNTTNTLALHHRPCFSKWIKVLKTRSCISYQMQRNQIQHKCIPIASNT
jgi:hypothetical protein